MAKRLAALWLVSAAALMLLPVVFSGVHIDDWKTAAIAAVGVGLVNVAIGPVLKLVTLPLRWLTLGLFTWVINGFLLVVVTKIVDGFTIDGFGTAVLASVVYSAVTWVGGLVLVPSD